MIVDFLLCLLPPFLNKNYMILCRLNKNSMLTLFICQTFFMNSVSVVCIGIVTFGTRYFFKEYKHYTFEYGSRMVINLIVLTWNHIIDNLQTPSFNSDILALNFMCLLIFFKRAKGFWDLLASRGRDGTKRRVSVIRNV